jgi:hypothetical protein
MPADNIEYKGGEIYGFTNFPGLNTGEKAIVYEVPNYLVDCFTERGICDLIWKFISIFEKREIKTIAAYSCHCDTPGKSAFIHPSMKEEDQEMFIAMLESRKAEMLSRFPTEVLEAELAKRKQ